MKRSLGAEIATGTVEKPIDSVVKLEKKILDSIPDADSDQDLAIFSTDAQLNLYRKSNTIICDGLFKYRPQESYQIYRIFGFVEHSHCILLITVIMRGNDRKMYEKMWEKVDDRQTKVQRRVRALKKYQLESIDLESKFYYRVHELEKEFQPLFNAINLNSIGEHEPADKECDVPLIQNLDEDEL
uniref:Uncharacterized protein n=1 Tax=Ditylenchus dipsaci TaxID=166011 RepID=A0A915D3S8_9BILA